MEKEDTNVWISQQVLKSATNLRIQLEYLFKNETHRTGARLPVRWQLTQNDAQRCI